MPVMTFRLQGGTETVRAIQFNGNFDEVESFVGGDAEWRGNHVVVASKQGALQAKNGEWFVLNKRGYFNVLPPHLFDDAYTRHTV